MANEHKECLIKNVNKLINYINTLIKNVNKEET